VFSGCGQPWFKAKADITKIDGFGEIAQADNRDIIRRNCGAGYPLEPGILENRTFEFGLTNPDWQKKTGYTGGNRPVLPGEVMDECRQIQKCLRACSWDADMITGVWC